jgi:hypothetical protein
MKKRGIGWKNPPKPRAEAKEMGAIECLAKPFEIGELKTQIKECFSKK